jgi:hypothetical protein
MVPEYLPLCASRPELLPDPCRSCAWWQTAGIARVSPETAATVRRRWTSNLESGWSNPGLIRLPDGSADASDARNASSDGGWVVHYAPVANLPRLRDLFFTRLPPEAVVLFCLRGDGPADSRVASRLLHAALKQLKQQHLREIFALACLEDGAPQGERCEFFSRAFLQANGFEELQSCGEVFLMRADLRGLLSVLSPLENALKRMFHHEPAPSPAAWSSRGPS